jgi:hypothetical protein
MSTRHLSDPKTLAGVKNRENMSRGREIVRVDARAVQGDFGQKQIEVVNVSGVAVGKDGWALAHEAFKAGFQIRTALEATQRSQLNPTEKNLLDDVTNSNAAEIRQGLFGPLFAHQFQEFIFELMGQRDWNGYFTIIERAFSSMPERLFTDFVADAFSDHRDLKALRSKYNDFLLLDEFQ